MAINKAEENGGRIIRDWAPTIAACVVVFISIINWGSNQGSYSAALEGIKEKNLDLDRRVLRNEADIAHLTNVFSAGDKSDCQQFAKVETQFAAVEEILNDIHINELRFQDNVNQKLFALQPSGKYHELRVDHQILPC